MFIFQPTPDVAKKSAAVSDGENSGRFYHVPDDGNQKEQNDSQVGHISMEGRSPGRTGRVLVGPPLIQR